jgi:hypothetical protein
VLSKESNKQQKRLQYQIDIAGDVAPLHGKVGGS